MKTLLIAAISMIVLGACSSPERRSEQPEPTFIAVAICLDGNEATDNIVYTDYEKCMSSAFEIFRDRPDAMSFKCVNIET